jgi:predicted metal-dependent peptidase
MLPKHDRKLKDRDLWRSVVLTALGSCRSQDRRRTLRRPDRRDHTNPFGRENPMQGSRSVVILDTSGSCLADIPDFLGVVERAVRWYGAVVDIMLVGDDVYAIHKNVARLNPGSLELKTGGTDLTAAQKIIARDYPQRTTNVVVLTDGETAWLEDWGFRTSAVYTHGHRKLPGVTKFAVLQPKSDDCEERL